MHPVPDAILIVAFELKEAHCALRFFSISITTSVVVARQIKTRYWRMPSNQYRVEEWKSVESTYIMPVYRSAHMLDMTFKVLKVIASICRWANSCIGIARLIPTSDYAAKYFIRGVASKLGELTGTAIFLMILQFILRILP